jgi:radical SAM protein with 4Fe4S-binding SPASM domain
VTLRYSNEEEEMPITSDHDFFIQWHLTERCNLRCSHCYQSGQGTDELSLAEIREVAEEVSDMLAAWSEIYEITFSPSFNITGGEPFLREDLFDIIDHLSGRRFALYLLTNGTLIDREKAVRLAMTGVEGVQVSIEGPEGIHDRIRGKGSFAASLRGISFLLDAGITVTLNATLSEINANHFPEMVSLASSIGAQRLGFSRLVPSGRGAGLIEKMIGKERIGNIYGEIFSMTAEHLEIVTGDPVASQMSAESGNHDQGAVPTAGCAAGLSGLTFLPDGTITPCRRLFIPIGNVRKDNLREIWATSNVLNALRDRSSYSGKCGTCRRWAGCRGCRAIAYAYALSKGEDDFLAEDPQCFIAQ